MSTASTDSGEHHATAVRLEGSLARTPLAELLRRVAVEERSGDLEIAGPGFVKTIYFDRGFVVFASSNRKTDRLGESMIEAGRISRHEFALASMLMKSTNQKFGQVLVEAGIVPEEELGRYVAAQVNRIVLSLFLAKQGKYRFVERPCSIPVDLMVSLSVYRILIEGVRRMSRKSLVLAGLPPPETELEVVDQPPFSLDVDKLRPEEKAVLRAARTGATIRDIVEIVDGHDGVTLRACYGLLCGGVLEPVKKDPRDRLLQVQEETGTFVLSEIRHKVEPIAQPVAPTATPPAPPMRVERTPAPVAVAPPIEPEVETSDGPTLGDVLDFFARAWNTVLGWLGRESTPPSPPRTSTRPAPRPVLNPPPPAAETKPAPTPTEPDKVESLGVPEWSQKDAPDEGASKPPAAESIGAPAWSLKSDDVDSDGPSVPSWSMLDPENDASPTAEIAPDPSAPEDVAPAPDSVRLEPPSWSIADVPEPPEDVPLDTSQTLDVEPDFHEEPLPDLDSELFIEGDVSGGDDPSMLRQIPVENVEISQDLEIEIDLEDVEEDVARLPETGEIALEAVSPAPAEPAPAEPEATPAPEPPRPESGSRRSSPPVAETTPKDYEIAPDEPRGTSYEQEMRRMKQSGGEQRLLRDVKLHFRMRDFQGAVPLLQQLVAISPGKALYRGMLGRAMARDPARRKDAEEHFIEALRLAPQDPELHYWLGLYYKSFGLSSRAITEFRTTLRINPKHEGARKQLGGSKKDDALGSVLKKIFG